MLHFQVCVDPLRRVQDQWPAFERLEGPQLWNTFHGKVTTMAVTAVHGPRANAVVDALSGKGRTFGHPKALSQAPN